MKNKTKNLSNWQNFLTLCLQEKTEKELELLFDLFLTKAEQEDVALRYDIIKELLSEQKTQRQIAADHNVSIAKVTRGSNALRIADPKIKKIIHNTRQINV